jgi:hypothetical protein
MDVTEYYHKVSHLIKSKEMNGCNVSKEISVYLNNEDDESPRHWVPLVQDKLLEAAQTLFPSEMSTQFLELYIEGQIMESGYLRIKGYQLALSLVVTLIVGIGLGWLFSVG